MRSPSASPGSGARRVVAQSLAAHSLLGIVLGALIYQVCLTGALSMFAAEWKQWEQPDAPRVESVTPEGFAAAMANGVALAGDPRATVVVFGPTSALPRFEVRLPGRYEGWATADGRIERAVATPWSRFISELHESMHLAQPWGNIVIAIAGVALLAAIGTGVFAHHRIFRDAFRLRFGGSKLLETADLHNRMSVWALPFHTAIAFTGAVLALITLLSAPLAFVVYRGDIDRARFEVIGPGASTDETKSAPLPDIADMIRSVEAQSVPARVDFLLAEAAGTAGRSIEIGTDAPRDLANGESYFFRRQGESLGHAGYTDGAADKQIRGAIYPLHVGKFGGLPLRILYCILGLVLCWITASGMTLWFARMRRRGVIAERRERLWCAVLWGQPVALAASALAAVTGWATPAPVYLVATILALLAAAVPSSIAILARALRVTTAALLVMLVIVHADAHGFVGDAVVRMVNLVLGLTACIFLMSAISAPRRHAEGHGLD
jgi:uncharacterized iron-regulated membrane protein